MHRSVTGPVRRRGRAPFLGPPPDGTPPTGSLRRPAPGIPARMDTLLHTLGTILDLLTVIVGFGLIVFVHELGHFLAARWAGIRVLAFAVGFGPALLSFRKGMGLRRGSSEAAYRHLLATTEAPGLSPTEYRLNILPFGGYVKMLGQEDLDPSARSPAPDSYQSVRPWKRMIVISAGVVMNLVTSAILFVAVFTIGLEVEPPIVGAVAPGLPAAEARPVGAPEGTPTGLLPGDRIVSVDGVQPDAFTDVSVEVAMAGRDQPVRLGVVRPGVPSPLLFEVSPRPGEASGLLEIGIDPARARRLTGGRNAAESAQLGAIYASLGLPPGLEPGMTLVEIDGAPAADGYAVTRAARASEGRPLAATFTSADGRSAHVELAPRPEFQSDVTRQKGADAATIAVDHLLGLAPVIAVRTANDAGKAQGLRDGDVFARIGGVEYPTLAEGIGQIRAAAGGILPVAVLRATGDGGWEHVRLPEVRVSRAGTIGFAAGDTSETTAIVAGVPTLVRAGAAVRPAAADVISSPGTRIVSVAGEAVENLAGVRAALRRAAGASGPFEVELEVRRPVAGVIATDGPTERVSWTIGETDAAALRTLSWRSPIPAGLFDVEQMIDRANGPVDAIGKGLTRTRRVMLTTYLTFARLADQTVKVEHLKGPVGIAHLGTLVADKGPVWLMFFLALISVNLAVINFLPLPIVDGGQFLFLLFEQIRGRPVPVGVQNAATMVGLLLIGSIFLLVTYNDLARLLGF